jgi:hypothetical protein
VHAVENVNIRPHTPLPTRAEQINALKTTEFDVLVIGGGATGKLEKTVPVLEKKTGDKILKHLTESPFLAGESLFFIFSCLVLRKFFFFTL